MHLRNTRRDQSTGKHIIFYVHFPFRVHKSSAFVFKSSLREKLSADILNFPELRMLMSPWCDHNCQIKGGNNKNYRLNKKLKFLVNLLLLSAALILYLTRYSRLPDGSFLAI